MTSQEFDRFIANVSRHALPSQDAFLADLRRRGASMVQAIKAVSRIFGLSLGESKVAASRHASWQTVSQAAQPLHIALETLADQFDGTDSLPASERVSHTPGRRGA